jgi:3-oxoadipate enol-lactonase
VPGALADGMLSHERSGPSGPIPLLLIHAGIADRRMWDPIWPTLTATRDVVRVDLRGYGESTERPDGPWSPRADVLEVLDHLGIDRVHAIGCSFGAGVAFEVALERPGLVASLVLAAPGGALLTERTDELVAFFEDEGAAVDAGDLDAAAEANVVAWVDGPHRGPDVVPAAVRDAVRAMQRRAFDVNVGWPDDVWEAEDELDPEASQRLGEITAPTLVISGKLDIDSVQLAADHLLAGLDNVRGVTWDDVAHLPSMERPDDFAAEVLDWVARAEE